MRDETGSATKKADEPIPETEKNFGLRRELSRTLADFGFSIRGFMSEKQSEILILGLRSETNLKSKI